MSRRFTIDFNYNSNHLEGNTLTYGQTEILLLFGKVIGEANVKDVQDMTASNVTLNMMKEEATIKETPLTQAFIRTLHKTLLREDYTVYRNITRYGDRFEYASPEETPALMTDLVDWYNKAEAEGKLSPVELAVLFHYRYIRIHPFEDGNGRIARLLVNYILTKHDYPMIVVRSRLKNEYLEALHAADLIVGSSPSAGAKASLTKIKPFVQYFKKLLAKEIYNDVLFLTEHDENLWWYDGERIEFRSLNYSKLLVLMMSEPVLTLEEMQRHLNINMSAVKKLVNQLMEKKYIERGTEDGSWRVFITPSV